MPLGPQVLDFDLRASFIQTKIWSLSTSDQIAFACSFFQLGKFLIGGFPSLVALLSIALRTTALANEQVRRADDFSF
ncbi:hypothetical protein AKJ16_DCAP25349 [Drosera capensis]